MLIILPVAFAIISTPHSQNSPVVSSEGQGGQKKIHKSNSSFAFLLLLLPFMFLFWEILSSERKCLPFLPLVTVTVGMTLIAAAMFVLMKIFVAFEKKKKCNSLKHRQESPLYYEYVLTLERLGLCRKNILFCQTSYLLKHYYLIMIARLNTIPCFLPVKNLSCYNEMVVSSKIQPKRKHEITAFSRFLREALTSPTSAVLSSSVTPCIHLIIIIPHPKSLPSRASPEQLHQHQQLGAALKPKVRITVVSCHSHARTHARPQDQENKKSPHRLIGLIGPTNRPID